MRSIKRTLLCLFIVIVIALMFGCAERHFAKMTSPVFDSMIQKELKNSQKAVVYFMRTQFYGWGLGCEVIINDRCIGLLDRWAYCYAELEAGQYYIGGCIYPDRCRRYRMRNPLPLFVEPGKKYYLEMKLDKNFEAHEIDETSGLKMLKKCELTGVPSHFVMVFKEGAVYISKILRIPNTSFYTERILIERDEITEDYSFGNYLLGFEIGTSGNYLPDLKKGLYIIPPNNKYVYVELKGKHLAVNKDLLLSYKVNPNFLFGENSATYMLTNAKVEMSLDGKAIDVKSILDSRSFINSTPYEQCTINISDGKDGGTPRFLIFANRSYPSITSDLAYQQIDTYEDLLKAIK